MLADKGAVISWSLLKTWCYVCILKLPHCSGFHYALHYPEGEDGARDAMSLRIGELIIAITQDIPC